MKTGISNWHICNFDPAKIKVFAFISDRYTITFTAQVYEP